MNEVSVNALDIGGKEFILVETIDKYNFFVETANVENICVLKEIMDEGEEKFVDVDDNEFDKAFSLYYEKLKSSN